MGTPRIVCICRRTNASVMNDVTRNRFFQDSHVTCLEKSVKSLRSNLETTIIRDGSREAS